MTYRYSVTVFCGSNPGKNPVYAQAAKELGTGLVDHHFRLVFGGGNIGLMGILSDTVLALGGTVKGIMPEFLRQKEGDHTGLKDLIITEDMHARKKLLYKEGDAFIIFPGGIGTFDEFFEILTWKYLQRHNKPILIANINHWADPLLTLLQHTIQEGFAPSSLLQLFEICTDVEHILKRLQIFAQRK